MCGARAHEDFDLFSLKVHRNKIVLNIKVSMPGMKEDGVFRLLFNPRYRDSGFIEGKSLDSWMSRRNVRASINN
jgi:hypothetical protein